MPSLPDVSAGAVMTSAMHDQKAMDGGGSGNSLFTDTLVDAVENLRADHNGDGFITTTDLFLYGAPAGRRHGRPGSSCEADTGLRLPDG